LQQLKNLAAKIGIQLAPIFLSACISLLRESMMVGYKGYLIFGQAMRVHPSSSGWWRSQGNVFTDSPEASILVASLEGVIFESQRAAQDHALELCKEWVDKNLPSKKA
jgi:hypothetical protein